MGPTESSVTSLLLPKQMPGLNLYGATVHLAELETFFDIFVWFLIPLVVATLVLTAWLLYEKPARRYSRYVDETDEEWVDAQEDWVLTDGVVEERAPLAPSQHNAVKEGPLSPEEVQRLKCLIFVGGKAQNASAWKRKHSVPESLRRRKVKIETEDGVSARWVSEYGSCADEGESDELKTAAEDWVYPFTFRAAHPDRDIKRPKRLRT